MQALTMLELRNYNKDIAYISEIRIPDSSHSVITVFGETGYCHLCYSEVVDNSGRHDIAIDLNNASQAALLAWAPISSHLACARIKGAIVNLTVITVYAPTLQAQEEGKDSFHVDFQDAVDRVPAADMLNARPGPADMATRHILVKFALDPRNANGDRLENVTSANHLVVSSTRF